MPVASGTARTRFTQLALFSQRYGSFAGKTAAAVATPRKVRLTGDYNRTVRVTGDYTRTIRVTGEWED